MQNKITYKKSVAKDYKNIDHFQRIKIAKQIEEELTKNPMCGKRLTGDFAGLYSLRIGDYRIIYTLGQNVVLILRIAHRKEVYRG
ncbi:MAG: type II toxin-antitoxin system RelE/ParE family toxin [Elusimicrobia bacterium]|nr:type II toxin-antitoxin system RelE/ParE family toxin [Elusimicrobiota bacterium]